MPSVSEKQHRLFEAVAHSPSFAKKVGIPQSVGKEFAEADKRKSAKDNWKPIADSFAKLCADEPREDDEKAEDCAQDAMALDKSARKVDQDGHFHVKDSVISAAQTNPYKGSEIPDYDRLGLRASGVYDLYRDANALEKGTPSLQGKPLLMKHKPVSADDHPKSIVVGSVNNPRFENGKVIADLVVWDQDAIDSIEDGSQRDLSAGYRYVPVIEDGTAPDGSKYQGRMTDILFNHVALVTDGRVSGAMVADSAEGLGWDAIGEAIGWLNLANWLAQDAWAEGDHPRGGNQENKGQFSKGSGCGVLGKVSNFFKKKDAPARSTPWSFATVTPEEESAIKAYTGSKTYDVINTALRAGKMPGGDAGAAVRSLDGICKNASYDGFLCRCVGANIVAKLEADGALKPGGTFVDNGFSSFTKSEHTARTWMYGDGAKGAIVRTRGGKGFADISALSRFRKESEVLLARGTPLRVVSWHPGSRILEVDIDHAKGGASDAWEEGKHPRAKNGQFGSGGGVGGKSARAQPVKAAKAEGHGKPTGAPDPKAVSGKKESTGKVASNAGGTLKPLPASKIRAYTDAEFPWEYREYTKYASQEFPSAFKSEADFKKQYDAAPLEALSYEQLKKLDYSTAGSFLGAPVAKAHKAFGHRRDTARIEKDLLEGKSAPPIVLKVGNRLRILGGNTRLSMAAAHGYSMPVKIIDITKSQAKDCTLDDAKFEEHKHKRDKNGKFAKQAEKGTPKTGGKKELIAAAQKLGMTWHKAHNMKKGDLEKAVALLTGEAKPEIEAPKLPEVKVAPAAAMNAASEAKPKEGGKAEMIKAAQALGMSWHKAYNMKKADLANAIENLKSGKVGEAKTALPQETVLKIAEKFGVEPEKVQAAAEKVAGKLQQVKNSALFMSKEDLLDVAGTLGFDVNYWKNQPYTKEKVQAFVAAKALGAGFTESWSGNDPKFSEETHKKINDALAGVAPEELKAKVAAAQKEKAEQQAKEKAAKAAEEAAKPKPPGHGLSPQHKPDWVKNLPDKQKQAIAQWSNGKYEPINSYLRGQSSHLGDDNREYIEHLDKVFAQAEYPHTVWRGVPYHVGEQWLKDGALVEGGVIVDSGFAAFSRSESFATSWGGGFTIEMKGGGNGLVEMEEISHHPHEKEVLLARGTALHVVSYDPANKRVVVEMKSTAGEHAKPLPEKKEAATASPSAPPTGAPQPSKPKAPAKTKKAKPDANLSPEQHAQNMGKIKDIAAMYPYGYTGTQNAKAKAAELGLKVGNKTGKFAQSAAIATLGGFTVGSKTHKYTVGHLANAAKAGLQPKDINPYLPESLKSTPLGGIKDYNDINALSTAIIEAKAAHGKMAA